MTHRPGSGYRTGAAWRIAISVAALCAAPSCARSPKAAVVTMLDFAFSPAKTQVVPGDTVVFRNDDAVPHTATSDPGSLPAWSSGDLQPGHSWRWIATGAGVHPFHCDYHPTMRGTVVVR